MGILEVDEVLGRSQQGITRPFICRCSDRHLYFVKGKGAGHASLAKEWIAGRLAQRFGLPIPQFSILSVPRDLVEGSDANLSGLGHGLAFGSRAVEDVDEISVTNIQNISQDIMRDIVAFDWFVMNGDRTLSADGGNPNILWSLSENRPYVIDHNLAFDENVTLGSLEPATYLDLCCGRLQIRPACSGIMGSASRRVSPAGGYPSRHARAMELYRRPTDACDRRTV